MLTLLECRRLVLGEHPKRLEAYCSITFTGNSKRIIYTPPYNMLAAGNVRWNHGHSARA